MVDIHEGNGGVRKGGPDAAREEFVREAQRLERARASGLGRTPLDDDDADLHDGEDDDEDGSSA